MNTRYPDSGKLRVCESVVRAACTSEKVAEAPHDFYKYPARFSPLFAREAIKAFTAPGEMVLDPFCGGGTTVVEAMKLGRRAVGFDVSSLATFLARTKTTPLSTRDLGSISVWAELMAQETPQDPGMPTAPDLDTNYYERNLPANSRLFFRWVLQRLVLLDNSRQEDFVRMILLAVGQWGLDCKTTEPTVQNLKDELLRRIAEATEEFYAYTTCVAEENGIPRCRIRSLRRILNRTAEESGIDGRVPKSWLPARLVLTSPPYPGVHMVYHRWQINGRKETPVPFMLANQRDGAGESYYCLGSRSEPKLDTYYERLRNVFDSILPLIDGNTLIVQLVAFSSPTWQLPKYLETLEAVGFVEVPLTNDSPKVVEGRLWREVPSRKWYATSKGDIAASKEVMLIHRLGRLAST